MPEKTTQTNINVTAAEVRTRLNIMSDSHRTKIFATLLLVEWN